MLDKLKKIFQAKENNLTKGVCKTTDIVLGSSKVVSYNNEEIAIFNIDNKFYAISNVCSHRGGPLAEGNCEGKIVTCPWHMWKFDVTTGKCTMNDTKVKKYEIQITNGEVFIK